MTNQRTLMLVHYKVVVKADQAGTYSQAAEVALRASC